MYKVLVVKSDYFIMIGKLQLVLRMYKLRLKTKHYFIIQLNKNVAKIINDTIQFLYIITIKILYRQMRLYLIAICQDDYKIEDLITKLGIQP